MNRIRSRAFALLAAAFVALPATVHAAKPPAADPGLRQVPPAEAVATRLTPDGRQRVEAETGRPVVLRGLSFRVDAGTPEDMARRFLELWGPKLRLGAGDLAGLELRAVRTGPAGSTVRFRQLAGGVPVWRAEIAVTLDRDDRVRYVIADGRPGLELATAAPAVARDAARAAAFDRLGARGGIDFEAVDLVVYPGTRSSGPRLAWQVRVEPRAPAGSWEVLVDAATGEVFRVEDRLAYGTPTTVDGTGSAFEPDPLSSALVAYGTTGYVDGADADTAELTAEIGTVTLHEITEDGGTHFLTGPWAECVDWDTPFKGCFSQASSTFSFTRTQDGFEATNTYHHIDRFMRYMNVTLGVSVEPYQYTTGVRFDPHGFSGADNSSYSSGTGRLRFGEGGVDDAEDADVVIHELGHGIHDWVTVGGLSQVEGLSEGTGDYLAVSYSRTYNQWTPADPAYDWSFSWDGHNPFWPGRVTNWNDTHTYPGGLTGQIHTDGQFWASCNIDVAEIIGYDRADRAFLVGLGTTGGSTNQEDAAQAVLQAAVDLGYTPAEVQAFVTVYQDCGYAIVAPALFEDGFESGDTSAWSATVP